jgi:alpha-glucosidase
MNEPSIFYTPDAFKEFAKSVHRFDTENDFGEPLANLLWNKGICNRESYYDEFSHTVNGERVTNREVHNLFGTQMTKAVADALTEDEPQKRHFVLSRSSYPGMHRYAAIWTGDNHSWWEHLSLNIQQLISLNLAGFLFVGADTGGFGGDCTPEMLVRWTQLSAFAPFFRNHAAMWSKNQEPWAFDDKTLELCRASIKMRYALMPYIYGEFVRSACLGEPFIRGLFHDFKDAEKRLDEDQFLCGRSLLIAPVVQAASHGRMVYLPTGSWLKVRGGASGLSGERVQTGGDSFVEASLAEIPLYLKLGSLVPTIDPPLHTGAESTSKFRMIGFTDSSAECVVLLDDGERKYSSWSEYPKLICSVTKKDGKWDAKLSFEATPHRKVSVTMELWGSDGKKSNVSIQC